MITMGLGVAASQFPERYPCYPKFSSRFPSLLPVIVKSWACWCNPSPSRESSMRCILHLEFLHGPVSLTTASFRLVPYALGMRLLTNPCCVTRTPSESQLSADLAGQGHRSPFDDPSTVNTRLSPVIQSVSDAFVPCRRVGFRRGAGMKTCVRHHSTLVWKNENMNV